MTSGSLHDDAEQSNQQERPGLLLCDAAVASNARSSHWVATARLLASIPPIRHGPTGGSILFWLTIFICSLDGAKYLKSGAVAAVR
jgi:hypothetical protein